MYHSIQQQVSVNEGKERKREGKKIYICPLSLTRFLHSSFIYPIRSNPMLLLEKEIWSSLSLSLSHRFSSTSNVLNPSRSFFFAKEYSINNSIIDLNNFVRKEKYFLLSRFYIFWYCFFYLIFIFQEKLWIIDEYMKIVYSIMLTLIVNK